MFQNEDGRVFLPTAQRIWEQLVLGPIDIVDSLQGEAAVQAAQKAWTAVEQSGRTVYEEMVRQQQRQLQREQEKQAYAFAARRRTINRVGLPSVRQYRLTQLASDEEAWQKEFNQRSGAVPEVSLVLLLQITGKDGA